METRTRVTILGVSVDNITEGDAITTLAGFIHAGTPHQVFTPNPEMVMLARRDPAFRAVLNGADLAVPDGVGLLLAAHLLGQPLCAHVRGVDLLLHLAARSAREGWRWFLLGAEAGVAEAAGRELASRYPGLQIAGAHAGSPAEQDDDAMRRALAAAGPIQILAVAYGAPRQEAWIARNAAATAIPVQIGVGGAFNFITGRSPRAPGWVRSLELEWAYRLVTEPWRWRRQLALPAFAMLATADAARRRAAARRHRAG